MLNYTLFQISADLIIGHHLIMLSGYQNGMDTDRDHCTKIVLILYSDLKSFQFNMTNYTQNAETLHIEAEEREVEGGGRGTRKLKEKLPKGEGGRVEAKNKEGEFVADVETLKP